MKVTTKTNLFITVWIIILLIATNITVYYLFKSSAINTERDAAYETADIIVREIREARPDERPEAILNGHLTERSLIRIILPEKRVAAEAGNDPILFEKIKPEYTDKKELRTDTVLSDYRETQVLITYIPLVIGGQNEGCLQIARALEGLEIRLEILRWILIFSASLTAALSFFGIRFLTNLVMRPVSNMIYTMEKIEKDGTMIKIDIRGDTKDELRVMAETFNKMIERLQENMEKQKKFVSDASHEFKTPLTVIKSYANLLRRHGFENEETAREAIEAIHAEAGRIQEMTEIFLDLAGLENENALELKEADISELCRKIVNQMKTAYKRDIVLFFEEAPVFAVIDALKIEQVIIILLDNAIKYSGDKIECFVKKDDENVRIVVRDYGIGIPEDEIANIFERFYRVDKARSRESGGSGLGLHIADTIVKLHKGKIAVTSEEGKGTAAEIILPLT